MAHNKETIFNQMVEIARRNKAIFFSDLCDFCGVSREWFYKAFPVKSQKYNVLERMLRENRVSMKNALRFNWFKSDNPSLQIALYKLIATSEERQILTGYKMEFSGKEGGQILRVEIVDSREKGTNVTESEEVANGEKCCTN